MLEAKAEAEEVTDALVIEMMVERGYGRVRARDRVLPLCRIIGSKGIKALVMIGVVIVAVEEEEAVVEGEEALLATIALTMVATER